ncbi:hypothetical protein ABIA33_004498 [Streptacidiphilus sp. MAP12-16]|uniref:DUF3068 domain-containing protein n=1 Tax=Streptacidiphilus sp. MAP12-16 TaxID=3156300 RepID=UPI00351782EB
MHRRSSLLLVALAAFLAALGPLLRWYDYPRVVEVPANQYQVVVLQARDATLIDYSTLTGVPHRTVTIVQTLRGDSAAAAAEKRRTGRDVVVWDTLSYVLGNDGRMISSIPEVYVFDAHTQDPVHCCGESVDGDPVTRTGIEYKFPFDTQPRDYQYYDEQTRTSAPIHYQGVRMYRGMRVYYFEQTIPWTQVPFPRTMPAGVTGLTPASIAALGYQRWYTTVRTFWVDPVTGAPVNGEEQHHEELRFPAAGGRAPVTVFAGDVKIRSDYLDSTAALVKQQRILVLALSTYIPWGFPVVGALLLGCAFLLELRGRRRDGRASAGSAGSAGSVGDGDEDGGARQVPPPQRAPAAPLLGESVRPLGFDQVD